MSNHASTYRRLAKNNIFDLIEGGRANLPTIAKIRRMVRKARSWSARAQIPESQTPKAQTTRAKTSKAQIVMSNNSEAQIAQRPAPRRQPTGQTIQSPAPQNQPKESTALGPLTNILRGASWRRDRNQDPWAQEREPYSGKENPPPSENCQVDRLNAINTGLTYIDWTNNPIASRLILGTIENLPATHSH